MDKGLRQVASQLALLKVELFRQEAGRTAGATISLEQHASVERLALLPLGQRQDEPTQQERSLRLAQRTGVMAEPVDVILAT